MARYELEYAEREMTEIGIILRAWHKNRDSDSVRIQDFRRQEFTVGDELMEKLVHGVQPEHALMLTVGTNPIEGHRFRKGTYDFIHSSPETLDARQQLHLKEANHYLSYTPGMEPTSDLYVGHLVLVNLRTVAETLVDGGELSIVRAETILA